eukprot:gb/GFBE01041935.1/.p1 GENE.gb/GFBE01041935.1/~~gb/GFBE01041935.1/.p1  ORF type:complete len:147 (+),score=22.72 gb/GFBE01041935.1/:1-441(+)
MGCSGSQPSTQQPTLLVNRAKQQPCSEEMQGFSKLPVDSMKGWRLAHSSWLEDSMASSARRGDCRQDVPRSTLRPVAEDKEMAPLSEDEMEDAVDDMQQVFPTRSAMPRSDPAGATVTEILPVDSLPIHHKRQARDKGIQGVACSL